MARWRQGWYKLSFPEKFRHQLDGYMKSVKQLPDGLAVQYKSSLELKAFKYCDLNPKVEQWSVEPFHIHYSSPVDGKMHRYFPDVWIKFAGGEVFIVEIKASGETKPPRKNDKRYAQKLNTYLVNQSKWLTAKKFCESRGAHFMILTEKVLG